MSVCVTGGGGGGYYCMSTLIYLSVCLFPTPDPPCGGSVSIYLPYKWLLYHPATCFLPSYLSTPEVIKGTYTPIEALIIALSHILPFWLKYPNFPG